MAALCGANVTLTDGEQFPDCLKNCQETCKANGLKNVKTTALTWGSFSKNFLELPEFDIILSSDCFYDPKGKIYFFQWLKQHAIFWDTSPLSYLRNFPWSGNWDRSFLGSMDANLAIFGDAKLERPHSALSFRVFYGRKTCVAACGPRVGVDNVHVFRFWWYFGNCCVPAWSQS